ncbi:MAG: isoleucine--tRNA ligase, partial [Candidatus Omnitrophica bacterium CG1_02_49_10]
MDYKDTLNLPKTDFSMKADLPNREPQILQRWKDAAIYKRIMEKYADKKKYILHDGPPYANGNIHIGHALNKILKDIVVKFQTMQGRHAPYIPGWDCHGLPVEHQLFKELGIDKAGIDQLMFRKKAHKYAMKFVEIQKGEFERLGVFADWDNPYLTLDPEYEYGILTAFMELVKKGYIYKGLKPVNWCVNCETALAEAEVEYDMHKSTSVYVKFKLRSKSKETLRKITSYELRITDYDIYFLIWTTTPWTLVANVAITLNPLFKYSAVKTGGGILIMASDLVSRTMDAAGVKEYEVIEEMDGKSLEGLICGHPFIERDSKVVMGEYVSMEEGTGCVHTAPGHGQEDYETGLKYGLPVIMPVDGKGRFDNTAEEFSGMNIYDAGPKIVERLKKDGNLFHTREIEHSYPHCWRCGKPIAFRATSQWFMKIDHDDLRKKMIAAAGSAGKEGLVRWIPEQGRKRISSMLQSRPDWCLSRQRFWGVPIPVFYCKGCGEEILDPAVIENVAKLVRKEGSDSWFARPPAELMPEGYRCRKCKGTTFEKEKDILDVWF